MSLGSSHGHVCEFTIITFTTPTPLQSITKTNVTRVHPCDAGLELQRVDDRDRDPVRMVLDVTVQSSSSSATIAHLRVPVTWIALPIAHTVAISTCWAVPTWPWARVRASL